MEHPKPPSSLSGRVPSRSSEASRARELEEIAQMSRLERMALALRLGHRRVRLMALRQGRGPHSG